MTEKNISTPEKNHIFPFFAESRCFNFIAEQWVKNDRISIDVYKCQSRLLDDVRRRCPPVVIFGVGQSLLSSGIILRLAALSNRPTIVSLLKSRNEALLTECYAQGADRVVVVPYCSAKIFQALMTTLLRNEYYYPPYRIVSGIQTIKVGSSAVRLTKKTFDVAQYLFVNHGRLISKSRILQDLWGLDSSQCLTHRIEVHISHVRKLLALDGSHGWEIRARRGKGYGIFHSVNAYRPSACAANRVVGVNS